MATVTANKTPIQLLAPTSLAAGTTNRYTQDLRTSPGNSVLTCQVTNDASLTVQAVARLYVAHTSGSTPAVGDASWRQYSVLFGNGTTSGSVSTANFTVPLGVMHLMLEIAGHTGGSVTGIADISVVTSITSV